MGLILWILVNRKGVMKATVKLVNLLNLREKSEDCDGFMDLFTR